MLESLDHCRWDSIPFQFTSQRLRDFIDPNHLLIQIDEHLDLSRLVVPFGIADVVWAAHCLECILGLIPQSVYHHWRR